MVDGGISTTQEVLTASKPTTRLSSMCTTYDPRRQKPTEQAREGRTRLGQWLREMRKKSGLTQRELARNVGLEYYTVISQLEHGQGYISADRYRVWAEALGVEPAEFLRVLASLLWRRPLIPPGATPSE